MEISRQMQEAGDNSKQLQMIEPTINIGITEKRAREIFSEMSEVARQSYTQDAYELAMKRIRRFEELLMNKMERVDGMLAAFGDPSFQFLLTEAQKRAAASERESDYELLTELLANRVEKSTDRKIISNITKAVEIVDQIDDDALCALTVAYAITQWAPVSGNITEGLEILTDLFSSLYYRPLPSGFDWAEHLDILNAIRISPTATLMNFNEIFSLKLSGYVCVGIKKDSEECQKAYKLLKDSEVPLTILVEHELNRGYVRLCVRDRESMQIHQIIQASQEPHPIWREANSQEIVALNQVWNLYSTEAKVLEQVKLAFMNKWDEYEVLHKIRVWWESLPQGFTITPVGKVVAHANAQRYNKRVPDINESTRHK